MTVSSPIKIIVVDDDVDDHYLFKDAFLQLKIDAELIQLYDGLALLEYLKQNRNVVTDIIVMDINMPTMNGIDALQHLKSDAAFKNIPVYILSTTREESDHKKCIELGAIDFFIKPNNSADFYRILSRIFS